MCQQILIVKQYENYDYNSTQNTFSTSVNYPVNYKSLLIRKIK